MRISLPKRTRLLAITVIISTFAIGATMPVVDSLAAFQTADSSSSTGCDRIPYSSLRSQCVSQRSDLHDYCDARRGPVSCGSEKATQDLKSALTREENTVKSLKDKLNQLKDSRSRATDQTEKDRLAKEIEQTERDIYDGGKRVDQAIADINIRKKLIDDSIYNIGKCIDYRKATMYVFATAQDKLRGETDTNIIPLARSLRDKYEAEKRGHEMAITEKENALNTCKNSRF